MIERRETRPAPGVKQVFLQAALPQARLHALETLQQLNALDDSTLLTALGDRHARVREVAVRLSESRLAQSVDYSRRVAALADDADARVRLQVVLSMRECDDALKLPVLQKIALRDDVDSLTERALRSSVAARPWSLLQRLLEEHSERYSLIRNLAADVAAAGHEADCRSVVKRLSEKSAQVENRLAAFAGFVAFAVPRPEKIREWGGDYETIVKPLTGPAREIALRGAAEPLQRVCMDVLAGARTEEARATVVELLLPAHAGLKQTAAVAAINEARDGQLFEMAFLTWPQLQIDTRRKLIAGVIPSAPATLMDAVEKGRIAPAELDASARQSVRSTPPPCSRDSVPAASQGARLGSR